MVKTSNAELTRWSRLGGRPLMSLVEEVDGTVLPFFLDHGFVRVTRYMRDADNVLSAREIRLERMEGEEIAGVSISFDKYGRPAFQVQVERRLATGSQHWIRAANVVKQPKQYICFWGAPWWLPSRFWSSTQSRRVAKRLRALSPHMLAFIDDGEPNRHLRVTA